MSLEETRFFVYNCTTLIDLIVEHGVTSEGLAKALKTMTELRLVMAGHIPVFEPPKSEPKEVKAKRELDLNHCRERLNAAIQTYKEDTENRLAVRELEVAYALRPPPRKEAHWGVLDTYARAQIAAANSTPSPSSSASSSPSSSSSPPIATSVPAFDVDKDGKGSTSLAIWSIEEEMERRPDTYPAIAGDDNSQDSDSDSASMMSARSTFSSDNAAVASVEMAPRRSRNPLRKMFAKRR